MADEHQRFERLAVGHVVGGLDEVDAARFRSHLVSCRDCRSRVAELRGIADDLTATEREERAARAGAARTDLAERVEEEAEAEAPPRQRDIAPVRSWPWRVVVIGLLPLVVLGALAWVVWVRAEVAFQGAALQTANRALLAVAEGDQLPLELDPVAADVTGVVAVSDGRVVVTLAQLPPLDPDHALHAVLLDEDGEVVASGMRYSPSQLAEGWLFDTIGLDAAGAATTLVVRVERFEGDGYEPVQELVSAPLTGAAG